MQPIFRQILTCILIGSVILQGDGVSFSPYLAHGGRYGLRPLASAISGRVDIPLKAAATGDSPVFNGEHSGSAIELDLIESAERTLMSDDTPLEHKRSAIRSLMNCRHTHAFKVLSDALLRYKYDDNLAAEIIGAIGFMRQRGVLWHDTALQSHYSMIGAIWKAVDDVFQRRDFFHLVIDRPYNALTLRFSFPEGSDYRNRLNLFVVRLRHLYNDKGQFIGPYTHISKNINTEKTQGEILIEFNITISNLTDFWKALGTHDFRTNANGYYRAFTKEEMLDKLEQRARAFLDGMPDKGSAEYRDFLTYVYGDGTTQNPGLLNITRNPARYGDIDAIRLESSERLDIDTGQPRADNRCSYNMLVNVARYNPYFAHAIEYGDIQRWVYLARAAGSVFSSVYIMSLLRGYPEADHMFFISRDTFGSRLHFLLRNYLLKLAGSTAHNNEYGEEEWGSVENFTAVQLAFMKRLYLDYYRTAKVKMGGVEGYFRYRELKASFDESGNRHDLLPIYDKPGKGAKKIAEVERFKPTGRGSLEKPDITKVTLYTYDGDAIAEERVLAGEEIPHCETDVGGSSVKMWADGIGGEDGIVMPLAINALWEHFRRTPILKGLRRTDRDGKRIVPRICLIDEVAVGTWDFIGKFAIEEKTRRDLSEFDENELSAELAERLGGDYWALRDKDPYELTLDEIDNLQRLELELNRIRETNSSVNVDFFIGKPNSPQANEMDGYPKLQAESLIRDFGMTEEEARRAIDYVSDGADLLPHPFAVDEERRRSLPIIENDIPILLESRSVQISAYIKALELYNGVIRYYEDLYRREGVEALANLIRDRRVPIATRDKAIGILTHFKSEAAINAISDAIDKYLSRPQRSNLSDEEEELLDSMRAARRAMVIALLEEAVHIDFRADDAVALARVVNYENLMHQESLLRRLANRPRSSSINLLAQGMLNVIDKIRSNMVTVGIPFAVYSSIPGGSISRLKSERGIYVVPLMSDTQEAMQEELNRAAESIGSGRKVCMLSDSYGIDEIFAAAGSVINMQRSFLIGVAPSPPQDRAPAATTGELQSVFLAISQSA